MVILRFSGYRSSVHGLPVQRDLPTGVGSCKFVFCFHLLVLSSQSNNLILLLYHVIFLIIVFILCLLLTHYTFINSATVADKHIRDNTFSR